MLKKVKKFLTNKKKPLILLTACFLYLFVTLPAFFDHSHQLKNFEPYPDSLLFPLSARNLAMGRGLNLVTDWGQVNFWVPPLYSIYLTAFYLISSNPTIFYLANIILGLLTIFVIYKIIEKTTKKKIAIILGLFAYLSHLVIFWLPSLAMTENISILLFSVLILGLLENNEKLKLTLVGLSSLGLLLVRFSVFPILLVSTFILGYQLMKNPKKYYKKLITIILLSLISLLFLRDLTIVKTIETTLIDALNNQSFFNIKFIYPNLIKYSRALLLHKGGFLWLQIGLTSWPIILIFIYYLYQTKLKNRKILLISLFASLFPLQLVFYSFDSRYIIYSIIIFSLATAWLVDEIKSKKIIVLLIPLLLINIIFQIDLARQIIGSNIFKKSTAWQYESILHFNKSLNREDLLITALPPFLVDTYQTERYRVLPLSYTQEFMNKKIYVWGDDINYVNLQETYKNWMEDGKTIYISNSYITHHQNVISDFEGYKETFDLVLFKEGCKQTCNIYQLKTK